MSVAFKDRPSQSALGYGKSLLKIFGLETQVWIKWVNHLLSLNGKPRSRDKCHNPDALFFTPMALFLLMSLCVGRQVVGKAELRKRSGIISHCLIKPHLCI